MKLQAKNVTGSIVLSGILAIGLINIAGSGAQTVSAQATQATTQNATQTAQTSFSTPEQAGQALRAAAGAGDEATLTEILGPESKAILSSGDPAADKAALGSFVAKYDRMNRWVTMTDGSRVLYIGADNYPYPIPLAQNASSQWYFNSAAGKDEILARRIGKNELRAIDAVAAIAEAEDLYFASTNSYTDKIVSTPGKQDGLYWLVPDEQSTDSQAIQGQFAKDVATSIQSGTGPIIDGYSFRIIASKSGYSIMASPVTHGDSGIMTFVLNKGSEIYQKDLGPNSASTASFKANDGWTPAE